MVVVPVIAERITDHEPGQARAAGPGLLETGIRHRQGARARTAFTLVELLVVIGIIALLMAILLPILQRVRSQARAVACQANLHQWGLTISMYADENDDRLPRQAGGGGQPSDGSWAWIYFTSLDINYNHNDFVFCPMARRWEFDPDRTDGPYGRGLLLITGGKSTAWCHRWASADPDGSRPAWEISGSYGFNTHLSAVRRDRYAGSARNSVPILLDCAWAYVLVLSKDEPPTYDNEPLGVIKPMAVGCTMKGVCINRHSSSVNTLFLDWSVRKVGLKELWTLKWYPELDTANAWTRAGGVQPEDWPQWMRRFKDY